MNLHEKYSKYKIKYNNLKKMIGGNLSDLVSKIHEKNGTSTGNKFVITTAGGGYSGGYFIMSQFGASSTVLELNGPYAREASKEFVKEPMLEKFADLPAANKFAITSLKRSRDLITMTKTEIAELESLDYCYGIGIASSLVSKDYKKGFHQCNLVLLSNKSKYTIQIQFKKGVSFEKGTVSKHFRTRTEEDNICGNVLVIAMALVCGIINKETFDELIESTSGLTFENAKFTTTEQLKYGDITGARDDPSNNDRFIFNIVKVNEPIYRLLNEDDNEKVNSVLCIQKEGDFKYIINPPIESLGKYLEGEKSNITMLPGSFNPLHPGHTNVLKESMRIGNSKGLYELAVFNVDKSPLSIDTILQRLEPFKIVSEAIIITNTPRYIDKAVLFPGVSYAIGVDTAIRIFDPIYSDNNPSKMIADIFEIVRKGTRFFVKTRNFDTAGINPKYRLIKKLDGLVKLEDIRHFIPPFLNEYFIELAVNNEYASLSSSELRKNAL